MLQSAPFQFSMHTFKFDETMPERIAEDTISLVEVGSTQKEYYGKLQLLDLHGLDSAQRRSANTLNRDLETAWNTNEKVKRNRLGWYCVAARCQAIQALKRDFVRGSNTVHGQQTLSMAESGQASERVYPWLIRDWERIGDLLEDPVVIQRLAACSERIVELLLGGQPESMTLLFRQLAMRHGNDVFEAKSGITLSTVQRRESKGMRGYFHINFAAIKAMIEHERRHEKEPLKPIDIYNHPYTQSMLSAWMKDKVVQLQRDKRKNGEFEQLAERLKMLMGLAGGQLHEDTFRTEFGMSCDDARRLASNRFIDCSAAKAVLDKLVEKRLIPATVSTHLVREWSEQKDPATVETAAPEFVSQALGRKLTAQGMDPRVVALSLNIANRNEKVASPVELVKDVIKLGQLSNDVPVHALACLADPTLNDVDAHMKQHAVEVSRRKKNRGRELTEAYRLLMQYGLRLEDLPPPFSSAHVDKYVQDEDAPNELLLAEIRTRGDARSEEAVRRWIAMHEPATVPLALERLSEKSGDPLLRETGNIGRDVLRQFKSGDLFPPLPTLRGIVEGCDAQMSSKLLQDWYLSQAKRLEALPHLRRAFDVHALSQDVSVQGFRTTRSAKSKIMSESWFERLSVRMKNGIKVAEKDRNNMIAWAGIPLGTPGAHWMQALDEAGSVQAALDRWCKECIENNQIAEFLALIRLRESFDPPKCSDSMAAPSAPGASGLELAMLDKQRILQCRAQEKTKRPQPTHVLAYLPGLLYEDLIAWKPQFALSSKAAAPKIEPKYQIFDEALKQARELLPKGFRLSWDDVLKNLKLQQFLELRWQRNERTVLELFAALKTTIGLYVSRVSRNNGQ